MQEEGKLIGLAAAGDRAAFSDLVRIKRELVVRIATQITGNREDALDVAQGVFLKLWKGLAKFDRRRRFDTWLYRITVNAAIDSLRTKGPRGLIQPLPDDPAGLEVGEPAQAERQLDLSELQKAFRRLAAGLAPKQRTAFVLREIEGLETAEVARIMNVAESTVRNHVLQARRLLRAGLERDYPGLVPTVRGGREDGS